MLSEPKDPQSGATEATEGSSVKTKRITLAELGPRLPFGIRGQDGTLHKAIECKVWTGVEERAVGDMRAGSRESADFPSKLLAFMLTQVGPHDFETMKEAQRRVVLSQMYLGDALYAYFWLRVKCRGPKLPMDLQCPFCSFAIPYEADLNTLEVRTAEDEADLEWVYQLQHPIEIRGKPAAAFNVGPTRWATMEQATKAAAETGRYNSAGAKMDIIQGSIRGVVDREEMALIPRELDPMLKNDIEELSDLIDEHEIGPDVSVSEKCPRCQRKFRISLDWSYDNFFEGSSRSRAGRTS